MKSFKKLFLNCNFPNRILLDQIRLKSIWLMMVVQTFLLFPNKNSIRISFKVYKIGSLCVGYYPWWWRTSLALTHQHSNPKHNRFAPHVCLYTGNLLNIVYVYVFCKWISFVEYLKRKRNNLTSDGRRFWWGEAFICPLLEISINIISSHH